MTTIEEKTNAIITFMQGKWDQDHVYLLAYDYAPLVSFKRDEVKYHSSFDWIYPVITKIEDLGCRFESFPSEMPDKNNYYIAKIRTFYSDLFQEQFFFAKIHDNRVMAYFEVVAEFCAWYNEKFGKNER